MRAALAGRRNRDKLNARRDIVRAYRTGAFGGAAFNGKLKPLDQYMDTTDSPATRSAKGIHFFRSLQARGLPIKIERVERT